MASFLSRLRERTISIVSSSRSETSTPHPTALSAHPNVPVSNMLPTLIPPVDRKILSDPESFLASLTEEQEDALTGAVPTASERPAVMGLKPSTRKGSADASTRKASLPDTAEADKPESRGTSTTGPALGNSDSGRVTVSRLAQIASPGEWSTFGRKKERVSPVLGDFGEQMPSPEKQRESMDAPSTPNRSPDVSHSSTSPHTESTPSYKSAIVQDDSPSGTTSSPEHRSPKTPYRHGSRSKSRSRSRSSHSHSFFATPPSGDAGHDDGSPQTFGHPTPPETRGIGLVFAFERGHKVGGTSPDVPPMPALAHPALSSHSKSLIRTSHAEGDSSPDSTSSPATPPRKLRRDELQSTYPPHRRSSRMGGRWAEGGGGTASSSLPFTFGKPSRHHSNRPKAQQIFTSHSSTSEEHTNSTPTPGTRSRPGTRSGSGSRSTSSKSKKKGRRSSAELNARQATEEVGWPALVSKEILRLSLGDDRVSGSAPETDFGSGRQPATRSEDVPIVPDHHHEPLISSVSPHPPSLGHPIAFQGN